MIKTIMVYCPVHFYNCAYKFAQELMKKERAIVMLPSKFILDDPVHISNKENEDFILIDKAKIMKSDEIYILNKYEFLDSDTCNIINHAKSLHKNIIYKNI